MADRKLLRTIREKLKQAVRLFLTQLHRDHPAEHFYAILFEVDVSQSYTIRIAGSEESLTRLAEKYIAKGYRVRLGNLLESLRSLLRWDAPGDDKDGWYWGNQDDDLSVPLMIAQAVEAGLIREYDEKQPLRRLCLEALGELDREGVFGTDQEREKVLIGVTCCEVGFGEEEDIEELATLNPQKTIARLRRELRLAVEADGFLIPPNKRR